jgi:hypothetical protein
MVVPTATILHFILTFDGASRRRWKCRMESEENIKPFPSLPPTLGNRQRTTISHIPTARLLPHYNDISALHQHNCTRYRCPLGTFWAHSKIALGRYCKDDSYMAEGEGFEPPLPFRVKRFSRPPVSTTHTSLRGSVINSLPAPTACPNRRSSCSPASCGFPYEESTVYRHL